MNDSALSINQMSQKIAQILIVTCRLPYYGHYFAKSEKNAPADDDD